MDRSDWLFLFLIVTGLAAATVLATGRARIERSNRAVELIVDADDVRELSLATGVSVPDLLVQLRRSGATALGVQELTLEELQQLGYLHTLPNKAGGTTFLIAGDEKLASSLATALRFKLPGTTVKMAGNGKDLGVSALGPKISVDLTMDQLAEVPVFLRPDDLRAARAANLRMVGRLMNFGGASPKAITGAARAAAAADVRLVVFREDEVLGYQALLEETARAFRKYGLLYGFIEIASQKGDEALASKLASQLVRLHSMTDGEVQNTTRSVAVARYVRAVRERNIRACYLRLLAGPRRDPVAANTDYVRAVSTAIRAAGFGIGPPAPFKGPENWPPRDLRAVVLLALPAAFVVLVRRFAPVREGWAWALFLVVAGCGFALAQWRGPLVVPLSGLAAACIFPSLAVVGSLQWARSRSYSPRSRDAAGAALTGLILASVFSLVGGILIVGLFSRVGYLVGAGRFVGVKLSYLVPMSLVLLAVIGDLPGRVEPGSVWWARMQLRVRELFGRPLIVIEAIAILAALGAIVFALMRSGNQSLVAPTGLELKLRNLLESLLVVRPRTKEFLIGHPALMLAIAICLRGRRRWLPFAALLGAVGQISLVNTFCHFHTPLSVSLLRTLHGLWMGALVGIAVVLIWRLLFARQLRPTRS